MEHDSFATLPSILKLHCPQDSSFFAALSSDKNPQKAGEILKNILKRTALCTPNILLYEEWILARSYIASVEEKDAKDITYLTDFQSVQKRMSHVVEREHANTLLNKLHPICLSSMEKFLMQEHAYNTFENEGIYVTEQNAREYAKKNMAEYIAYARKTLDIK